MSYYGMFTENGNYQVQSLVKVAKALELTWPETYQLLSKLADKEGYGEATDTAVRESVYDACGFTTPFYNV